MDKNLPYNISTVRYLERQIALRRQALAPLRFREAALLQWVTKLKKDMRHLRQSQDVTIEKLRPFMVLFAELRIEDFGQCKPIVVTKKLSGVAVQWVEAMELISGTPAGPYDPLWTYAARPLLHSIHVLSIQQHYKEAALLALTTARNKLLRKINLFEKIQIPGMEQQILLIRRYLQDLEAVQASIQKMNRKKQQEAQHHD